MASMAVFSTNESDEPDNKLDMSFKDWGYLITPRYVKEAKLHVSNIILAYQRHAMTWRISCTMNDKLWREDGSSRKSWYEIW